MKRSLVVSILAIAIMAFFVGADIACSMESMETDNQHDWAVLGGTLSQLNHLTGGRIGGDLWTELKDYALSPTEIQSLSGREEVLVFSGRGRSGAEAGNRLAEEKGFNSLQLEAQTPGDPLAFFGINVSGKLPVEEKTTQHPELGKYIFMDFPRSSQMSVEVFAADAGAKKAMCKFKFQGFTFYLLEGASNGISGYKEILTQIRQPGAIISQATGFAAPTFCVKKEGKIELLRTVKAEDYPVQGLEEINIKFEPEFVWKSGASAIASKGLSFHNKPEDGLNGRWLIEDSFGICVGVGEGQIFVPVSYFLADRKLWNTK